MTDGVATHGAHYQGAFQAEVDAAGLFRQALAHADEQEGGAHADGPSKYGDGETPEPEFSRNLSHGTRAPWVSLCDGKFETCPTGAGRKYSSTEPDSTSRGW